MKLIIAGDRNFDDYDTLAMAADWMEAEYGIREIRSGCARGADSLGELYAFNHDIHLM